MVSLDRLCGLHKALCALIYFGAASLTCSCSYGPPELTISFKIDGEKPTYGYWFFPIVENDGQLELGRGLSKIADASGYQLTSVSASSPDNLARGWGTFSIQGYSRVGIVIFDSGASKSPMKNAARVFWLNTAAARNRNMITYKVPEYAKLPSIELDRNWYQ